MSKIFIIFLIFTLASSAPFLPVYNGALPFHYSLRIGKMAESLRRVYVTRQSKYNQNTKSFCFGIIPLCVNPVP